MIDLDSQPRSARAATSRPPTFGPLTAWYTEREGPNDMVDAGTGSSGTWLPAAITSIASFATAGAGYLALRVLDARKDERTYAREKRARDDVRRDKVIEFRNGLQRQTLLELQDSVFIMFQVACNIRYRKPDEPFEAEIIERTVTAVSQTNKLRERIHDAELRALLLEQGTHFQRLLKTMAEPTEAFDEITKLNGKVNSRIGSVLRTLDQVELAD